ncbi:MAG: hypothetical protein IPK13_19040 [Deltaproteobacteria bacterium]|nr:hypothetical protein [Deltaproteobacteria bacterium]
MRNDTKSKLKKARRWEEFVCPECDAHNPYGAEFEVGDEVFCCWCGCSFDVRSDPDDDDRFRLRRA